MGQEFLKKAVEIVLKNLNNPHFGVTELAQEMGISHSVLLRKLKALTGKSANRLIREIRLQRAMELIQHEGLTASEASHQTGFSSPAYFSNCFHEHFGYTPGEVKKKAESSTSEHYQSMILENLTGEIDKEKPVAATPNRKVFYGKIVLASFSIIILILAGFIIITNFKSSNDPKRIAVLPFRNFYSDTTQQWLGDGFRSDLLNNLSKINSFSLVSNISSDQYRNTTKSLKTIGKELNADYLIDGLIGIQGNNLKIWIGLVDPKKDRLLWVSDTLRKNEEELPEIPSDLAREIAGKFKAVLTPEETQEIEKIPTKSIEAYNYYQQGNYNLNDYKDVKLAIQLYEKAIGEDSLFAQAYCKLAASWLIEYWLYRNRDPGILIKCKQLIDQAFLISPGLPEAHLTLGSYYYRGMMNYDEALKQAEIVLKKQPRNIEALGMSGYIYRRAGKWDLSIQYLSRALEQNPRSYQTAVELGVTYQLIRNFKKAESYLNQAMLMKPDQISAYLSLTYMMLKYEGVTEKLKKLFDNAALNAKAIINNAEFVSIRFTADLYEGLYEKALNELPAMKSPVFEDQYYIRPKYYFYAVAYGYLKQPSLESAYYDSARVYLEKRLAAKPDDPRLHSALGLVYAGLHRDVQAIEAGKRALEYLPVKKEAIAGAFFYRILAEIYVITGKYKEALEQLRYVLSIPGTTTTKMLESDPLWAPLRDLPEFRKMIKEFEIK